LRDQVLMTNVTEWATPLVCLVGSKFMGVEGTCIWQYSIIWCIMFRWIGLCSKKQNRTFSISWHTFQGASWTSPSWLNYKTTLHGVVEWWLLSQMSGQGNSQYACHQH